MWEYMYGYMCLRALIFWYTVSLRCKHECFDIINFFTIPCCFTVILCVSDDIPHFLVEPQGAVVEPGMSVELLCSVSPNSTTVRWLLNGSVISSQRPRGVELREGSLKIAAFNELNDISHEGVYQCLASSPYGTIMSSEARVEEAGKTPSMITCHWLDNAHCATVTQYAMVSYNDLLCNVIQCNIK